MKLTLSTRRLYKVFPPSPCLAGLYAAMNLVRISSFLENSERTLGKGISNGKRKSKKKYKRSSRHASTSRKMTRQSYAVCVTSHHVSSGSSFKLRACFRVSGNVGTHYSGPVYYYDARVRAHRYRSLLFSHHSEYKCNHVLSPEHTTSYPIDRASFTLHTLIQLSPLFYPSLPPVPHSCPHRPNLNLRFCNATSSLSAVRT